MSDVPQTERLAARSLWRKLKAENAPFRIVGPDNLISVPEDCFDATLFAQATPHWRSLARIIGQTLAQLRDPYIQTSDLALIDRAETLIEAGRLRADGETSDIHRCRVRLPSHA